MNSVEKLDSKSKDIFMGGYETVCLNINLLHIGYFCSYLLRNNDFSKIPANININTGTENYTLKKEEIARELQTLKAQVKEGKQDFFTYLILANSIRGVVHGIIEVLKDEKIKSLFKKYIFKNNDGVFKNFKNVARFIRNTLSHNIRDQIKLKKDDYSLFLKKTSKGEIVKFKFDYKNFPESLGAKNYKAKNYKIDITIDLNKINDGDLFTDVISEYQLLLFIEFCYNSMLYLDKLIIEGEP